MEEMQNQQHWRERQICTIAQAAACSKQNTAAAVQDMLLARKYQRRAFKVSHGSACVAFLRALDIVRVNGECASFILGKNGTQLRPQFLFFIMR